MKVDLTRNKIRCDCGALIFDEFMHKLFLVETVNGELICPGCGMVHANRH